MGFTPVLWWLYSDLSCSGLWESISCQLTWGLQLASSSCWAFSAITVHTMWTQTVSLARSATQSKKPVFFPSHSVYHTLSWICECMQRCYTPSTVMLYAFLPGLCQILKWLSFIWIYVPMDGNSTSFSTACWPPAVCRQALPNRQPRPVQHQWLWWLH